MTQALQVDDWFVREVLPLEPALLRFFRRNWRNESEILDLRQELYVRLYESARGGLPTHTRAFVFTAARNLLINQVRRDRIVSMEAVADIDALSLSMDSITPEQQVSSREELRRLQAGLDGLPPRCRQVVMLRRIDGLSQRQVATRLGISESAVEKHMMNGMRALIDFMLGGAGRLPKRRSAARRGEARQS